MCEVRDIIMIDSYKDNGRELNRHSFIVISDENGQIQGLDYNLICNVMSSFKNEEQKKKKLRFSGNFPISHNDSKTNPHNEKDGYIKSEQFYYFNKDKIDYKVIGSINEDTFNFLIEFIENIKTPIKEIIDNL